MNPIEKTVAPSKKVYLTLLVNGDIPRNTACPYRPGCMIADANGCRHKGSKHETSFSCAMARSFDQYGQPIGTIRRP
jgi:hypothetical protein